MKRGLLIILLLVGCSSPPPPISIPAECIRTNWYELGRREIESGNTNKEYARLEEQCQRAGVPPSAAVYENGRRDGLEFFCTRENGYAFGKSGRDYLRNCPPEKESEFFESYRAGLRYYASKLSQLVRFETPAHADLLRKESERALRKAAAE